MCCVLVLTFVSVTPWMELKPNCGSDRAWVYSVPADYADEEIRPELLAIKFANPESMYVLILLEFIANYVRPCYNSVESPSQNIPMNIDSSLLYTLRLTV
jgi:hypothetical protein